MDTTRIFPVRDAAPSSLRPDLIEGVILDRQIGAGATAKVYLAYDASDRAQRYAVKFLSAVLSFQEDALRRWKREAEVLLRLDHPNIVKGIRYGLVEERPFLVMEYLQGESLADRLRREERLPESEVLEIARASLRGLDAAHRAGIIHRDIKPANIIRLNDGSIKLTDFGLARDDSDDDLTMTGAIIGTPIYISPEQATGAVVSIQSDLYSLGTTLFHLAAGQPPFKELNTSLLLTRKITDDVPDIRLVEPSISGTLAFLVDRLCQRALDQRPGTPAEGLELLDRLESGELTTTAQPAASKSGKSRLQPLKSGDLGSDDLVLTTLVGDEEVHAAPHFLRSGEVLFYEDDTSKDCYILMSGKVEVLKSGRPIAVIDKEGSFIGEMSPLRGAPRSATVVARQDTVLLVVKEDQFHAFLSRHPEMAIHLARSLAERLETTNVRLSQQGQKLTNLSRLVQEMNGLMK